MKLLSFLPLFIFLGSGCALMDIDAPPNLEPRDHAVDAHVVEKGADSLMISYRSALCLTIDDKDKVVQDSCDKVGAQTVRLSTFEGEDKTFKIEFVGRGCVELDGQGKEASKNGVHLFVNRCANKETQKFRLRPAIDDHLYFNIVSLVSNKCLDIAYGLNDAGTPIHQWGCYPKLTSQMFFNPILRKQKKPLPKKLWTYWNSGEENMPPFYKANLAMWRLRLGSEWDVIVLDNIASSPYYFGRYADPKSIPSEDDLKKKIGVGEEGKLGIVGTLKYYIIFSDFVRLAVLKEHGGIYADPSVMLHTDLSEFTNILESTSQFSVAGYTSRHQANRDLRWADSLESFFIITYPQNIVIKKWLDNFKKYIDLKEPNMDANDHPMYDGTLGLVDNFDNTFKGLRNYLAIYTSFRYTILKNPNFIDQVFIKANVNLKDRGAFSLIEYGGFDNGTRLMQLNESEVDEAVDLLRNVSISKFPSVNSVEFIKEPFKYFFDKKNIFGRLNSFEKSKNPNVE